MPGLFGKVYYGSSDDKLAANCLSDNRVHDSLEIKLSDRNYTICADNNSSICGSYNDNGVLLVYEGYLFDLGTIATKVAECLHGRYFHDGERFLNDLRGSFHIIVIDKRNPEVKTIVYADHTASRPLFYSANMDWLVISPKVDLLVEQIIDRTVDKNAFVHFMISGHFPSGHTAIEEISVLGPGEYLIVQSGSLKKHRYFQFKLEPDDHIDKHDATKILDLTLAKCVLNHWKHAETPAILLSGGYDSQYIFHTIAQSVEDSSKLTTVTWGQEPGKREADMEIARKTAARYGTQHIEIVKNTDYWRIEYENMFEAQSAMTDSSFYHANELTVIRNLRKEHGIRSVIRGDECLGFGPDASSIQSALSTNSMSLPAHVSGILDWFTFGNQGIVEGYSQFLIEKVEQYHSNSYDCLKDELDFYERQHMNRNPLNHFKLRYTEVFCPLIDPDVLNIICKFPSKFRRHKHLFKGLLQSKVGRQLKIAQYNNLTDWGKKIGSSNEIKAFFVDEFDKLPSFFNPDYFGSLVLSMDSDERIDTRKKIINLIRPFKNKMPIKWIKKVVDNYKNASQNLFRIPVRQLVIRAAVLAKWNGSWITKN